MHDEPSTFPPIAGNPPAAHSACLPRERKERRDAAESRRRILAVARRLIGEHGVEAVSMHQIALAAGVGQATLYRRYANKGELCLDLLQERHEYLITTIIALVDTFQQQPPLARLDSVLQHLLAFLEDQGALLGAVAASETMCAMSATPHRDPHLNMSWLQWLHELIAGLFAEAMAHGEIDELDVAFTTDALLATLHPLLYRYQRQECGFSSERILQGVRHLFIHSLRHPTV